MREAVPHGGRVKVGPLGRRRQQQEPEVGGLHGDLGEAGGNVVEGGGHVVEGGGEEVGGILEERGHGVGCDGHAVEIHVTGLKSLLLGSSRSRNAE